MKLQKIEKGMVVHCNTEEEAKELIKWAHECGYKWLLSKNNCTHWNSNQGHGIYYYFGKFGKGIITYEIELDNKSIEFSDLIIPEPKFKVGDIVITKSRGESWVITDIDRSDKFTTFYRCSPSVCKTKATYIFKADEIELSLEEPAEEELTAEEAIKWLMDGCFDSRFYDIGGQPGDVYSVFDKFSAADIVDKIKQYKKDHTSLPPKEPETEWLYECYDLDKGENHYGIIFSEEKDAVEYCERWTIKHESNLGYTYRKVCRVKE